MCSGRLVRAGDVGATLKVKVLCSAPDYAAATKTSAASSTVAKAIFTAKGTVTITGSPQIGQELTADEGSWTPTPDSYTYQWYRNGTALTGKTAKTFTPTSTGSYTAESDRPQGRLHQRHRHLHRDSRP